MARTKRPLAERFWEKVDKKNGPRRFRGTAQFRRGRALVMLVTGPVVERRIMLPGKCGGNHIEESANH